jgi:hypothetical protein
MLDRLFLAVAALLLVASPLIGQTTNPSTTADSPEIADVKAAAREFMAAFSESDVAKSKAKFAGTDEAFEFVTIMHRALDAARKFEAAAEVKWPEEVKADRKDDGMDPKSMVARVDRQKVTITGDTALLQEGMTLKKIDGKWQVIDTFTAPAAIEEGFKSMLRNMPPIYSEITSDIEAGKFKSFKEAGAAAKKKMEELGQRLTTMPAK